MPTSWVRHLAVGLGLLLFVPSICCGDGREERSVWRLRRDVAERERQLARAQRELAEAQ